MFGHLKPVAGNDGRVVAVVQMIIEPPGVAARPAREGGDAVFCRDALQIIARRDEAVEQAPISFEHRRRVSDHLVDMIEGDACEPLGLMRLVDPEQIVHAPHALGELRLGQNPAAPEAAEAVHLRQAVGADELGTEVDRAPPRRSRRVQINFVDQHPRTGRGGKLAQGA